MFKNIFKPNSKQVGKAALGMTAAGTLALHMLILPWETRVYKPYWDDLGKVWTYCGGLTYPKPDITKTYTDDECESLEAAAVTVHENRLRSVINDAVESQVPDLTMAAFISWTYNVGPTAAANSTLVRLINASDFVGACNQLPRWTKVKGQVVKGLVNRRVKGDATRISEHTMCMVGIDPKYKTPLFERLYFNYQNWLASLK